MGGSDAGDGRIVVGVDGSPSSVRALQWAARLVPVVGTSITAVAAWQVQVAFGTFMPVDWDPEEIAKTVLTQAVEEAFHGSPPCPVEMKVSRGQAAHVLIEESKEAALLVVGSRGHGGFAGLLLGSVSSAVAEHAKCAVLIAHGDEHGEEAGHDADPETRVERRTPGAEER